jgi:hypothetical protein
MIRLARLIMHYRRTTAERSLYPSVESFPGMRASRKHGCASQGY